MITVRQFSGGSTGRARWRSSFVGHPMRSSIGRRACGPCPSCGKRTRRVSHNSLDGAHNAPPTTAHRPCNGTKQEERRTESGYNNARVSGRLTRLTSRASLRSDHDRWTARSRWSGRSDHDEWNAQGTSIPCKPSTRQSRRLEWRCFPPHRLMTCLNAFATRLTCREILRKRKPCRSNPFGGLRQIVGRMPRLCVGSKQQPIGPGCIQIPL